MQTVNTKGMAQIRQFLIQHHRLADLFERDLPMVDQILSAWAVSVEDQLVEGNPPTIEICAADSAHGCTTTYTISDDGIDDGIDRLAAKLGLVVGKGTYNGEKFWVRPGSNAIITAERVLELGEYF